jgi:hypothetical protein
MLDPQVNEGRGLESSNPLGLVTNLKLEYPSQTSVFERDT